MMGPHPEFTAREITHRILDSNFAFLGYGEFLFLSRSHRWLRSDRATYFQYLRFLVRVGRLHHHFGGAATSERM